MSFKYGTFSGKRDGRFYMDMDETSLKKLLDGIPALSLISQKVTEDVRQSHAGEKWLNTLCERIPQEVLDRVETFGSVRG